MSRALLMLVFCAPCMALAQESAVPTRAPSAADLAARQAQIRELVQRLETRMLRLTDELAETEPEKVERLREALESSGRLQIKARLEQLSTMLREGKLGDAEAAQAALLSDLEKLLDTLTRTDNELDRRREERRELQRLRRSVQDLSDAQRELAERTQQLAEALEDAKSQGDPQTAEEIAEALRRLERQQREIQRQAEELSEEMRQKAAEDRRMPAQPAVQRAAEKMQQSADRLGEQQPDAARPPQDEALESLQEAMQELDKSLRQVRQEELEETLAALETRFRKMLAAQQKIRDDVQAVAERDAELAQRSSQLAIAGDAEQQTTIADEADATLRILRDEGTTVILPDLVAQMVSDMRAAAEALREPDIGPVTRSRLDDLVAMLEEILAAIAQERQQNAEARQQQQQQSQQQGPQPLLPGSAELKLLKGAQLRVNTRTNELAEELPATKPQSAAEKIHAALRELAARQTALADLTRRMNETRQ